jgi:hypothetical protein
MQAYGIPVVGVSLNAVGAASPDIADVVRFCRAYSLPLADPVRDGAGPLAEAVLRINPRQRR